MFSGGKVCFLKKLRKWEGDSGRQEEKRKEE